MKPKYIKTFILTGIVLVQALLLTACQGSKKGGTVVNPLDAISDGSTQKSSVATTTTGTTSTVATTPTAVQPDQLVAGTLAKTDLYTADALADNCVDVTFTAKAAGVAVKGATVSFTIAQEPKVDDPGKLDPTSAISDKSGIIKTTYCAGVGETKATVVATSGALSSNAAAISVTARPDYLFAYSKADIHPQADGTLQLDIRDSGPDDCTMLYFSLTKKSAGVMAKSAIFNTQVDFPKLSKLAHKADTGATATDAITHKTYNTYTTTSNAAGIFAIPVCAGVALGTLLVTGTFIDTDLNKTYTTAAPLVVIRSGLVNYQNLTLTFDPVNARTLTGFFNTNSPDIHPFTVKAGARMDGMPITDYPVSIYSETGQVAVASGGYPSADDGTVKFSVQALHLADYRPYPVIGFSDIDTQTHCSPMGLSATASAPGALPTASAYITYSQLAKNWRSTMIYMVRGQESFNDANRNGIYDEGGFGFWDKNQNGVYDPGIDVITYNPTGSGPFDGATEWFIDLPTPFIDVDEDGVYTAGVDILVGDSYVPPNGKRDADTLIWKYEYLPIYMGISSFSALHGYFAHPNATLPATSLAKAYYDNLNSLGIGDNANPSLFPSGGTITAATSSADEVYPMYIYAHDICGNLLPGGAALNINFETVATAAVGPRNMTGHFYVQPGDGIVEPSRQLLKNAAGSASAAINFNSIDHPSAPYGYPVEFWLHIGACTAPCGGLVSVAGTYCDAETVKMNISADTLGLSTYVTLPHVQTCTCIAHASIVGGYCTCDSGYTLNTAVNPNTCI